MSLKSKHSYNTGDDDPTVQKANNKQGERYMLYSGVSLYNRYLKGMRIGAVTGFPRDLAACLWEQGWLQLVRVNAQCVLPDFQLGSLHSSLQLSGWLFAFLLICLIFYNLYLSV